MKNREVQLEDYKKIKGKKITLIIAVVCICIVTFALDVMTGSANLTFTEVWNALFHPDQVSGSICVIVRSMRFPIALMALVIGATLGVAGTLMQTILHNPLASPYTLGIGSAAGFGASLAIVMGLGTIGVSSLSFLFSMLVSFVIYKLGNKKGFDGGTILLTGIAILFLFTALQALIQYGASESENQAIVFWSFGSLQKTTWTKLLITFVVGAAVFPFIYKNSWKYTALQFGDVRAMSLGVDVKKLKLNSLIYVALLAAISVCFTGSIGFIGLAGPHIARLLVGDDSRFLYPMSALCGAAILSVSSVLSKVIQPGLIFPIGIITSLIGVPFFFALIFRKRGKKA